MTIHYCDTSDGKQIVCMCLRDQDHNEALFDLPVGQEGGAQ